MDGERNVKCGEAAPQIYIIGAGEVKGDLEKRDSSSFIYEHNYGVYGRIHIAGGEEVTLLSSTREARLRWRSAD